MRCNYCGCICDDTDERGYCSFCGKYFTVDGKVRWFLVNDPETRNAIENKMIKHMLLLESE